MPKVKPEQKLQQAKTAKQIEDDRKHKESYLRNVWKEAKDDEKKELEAKEAEKKKERKEKLAKMTEE